MKSVLLSDAIIEKILDQQAQAVSMAFINRKPTTEQVEDLIEICRAWLEGRSITKECREPKRMAVLEEAAHWTIEPPLPVTFGEVKLPDPPAPEPIQIFPPKVEELAPEPPRAKVEEPLAVKEPEAGHRPAKVQIHTARAIKAARFLTAGIPTAIKESELKEPHLISLRAWLCSHFDCKVSKLGRDIKPDEMATAITDASVGGMLTVPYSQEAA